MKCRLKLQEYLIQTGIDIYFLTHNSNEGISIYFNNKNVELIFNNVPNCKRITKLHQDYKHEN